MCMDSADATALEVAALGFRENDHVRIGLYGGMANNIYLHAKALAEAGHDVVFIRERDDHFVMSQPFWEDLRLTFPYDTLQQTTQLAGEDWDAFEREHGWEAPEWLWDPQSLSSSPQSEQAFEIAGMGYSHTDAAIVNVMRSCDALLVCGTKPCLLAHYSGRPFVIQPAGGELLMAALLLRMPRELEWRAWFNSEAWRTWWSGTPYEQAVADAFANCVAVGVHDPRLAMTFPLRTYGRPLSRRLPHTQIRALGTHTSVQAPLQSTELQAARDQIAERLDFELPRDRLIVLVPSRVDFYWKGHDRLVEALQHPRISAEMHFIFCGWGKDFPALSAIAEQSGWSVSFLRYVLSKPLLYDLMAAADIVVDNFVSGHYGATGAEAMGRGTPVLMWCDPKQYTPSLGQPPVLSARSKDEIEKTLLDCLDGSIDLSSRVALTHEWALTRHSTTATTSMLMDIFAEGDEALAAGAIAAGPSSQVSQNSRLGD